MSSTASRKETERTKLIQEKCQTLLTQMLRDEDNKYCVDCDAKGPRWASWNLGVFLCIRCAGIHRNLGVHISRVKSVNLDTWTPEQVISLQQMGNSRARAVYEAQLPDGFRRPQTDTALESFIRAKYEHKKYLAREWVPPSPPKVDWGKEIDEELEKQKRKKKAAQAGSALGLGIISSGSGDKKLTTTAKNSPLPAPLPKPKPGQSGGSPKTQRVSMNSTGGESNHSNDLLGLSSPTKPVQSTATELSTNELNNDSFSGFLSATPTLPADNKTEGGIADNSQNSQQSSLAKEEEDFFNHGSLGGTTGDKDKSGRLTKDSILALYGAAPTSTTSAHNPHTPQMNFGQPQTMYIGTGGFPGMSTGYMTPGGIPHSQQTQFMTPPNSASMYNAPVMTAPAAFTAPGMGMHIGGATSNVGFGAQFPIQGLSSVSAVGYPQQMAGIGMMPTGSGIMATGPAAPVNLMQTNQSILGGMPIVGTGVPVAQPPLSSMGMSMVGVPAAMTAPAYQTPNATTGANLNQQFGNLNIGNVWQ